MSHIENKTEATFYAIFQWFMGIGAITLLGLFIYHLVIGFQSPAYYYCLDFASGDGYGLARCASETTVWDSVWQNGWWSPLMFGFRVIDAWTNWTFGIFDFWYTDNILNMPLGLFTFPFWGYWIWKGFTWFWNW